MEQANRLGITGGNWDAAKQGSGHWMIGTPTHDEIKAKLEAQDYPITKRKIGEAVAGSAYVSEAEGEANAKLWADAGTTANKCGLLPSDLLRQRDELRRACEAAYRCIPHCIIPCDGGTEIGNILQSALASTKEPK